MLIPNNSFASGIASSAKAGSRDAIANRITIHAAARPEETHLLERLHGAVCERGGWVLHRVHTWRYAARMVFEFPRDACIDLYGAMASLGLRLSPASHLMMTDLCRRTPYLFDVSSRSITVEDHASLDRATVYICSLEFIKVELCVRFEAQSQLGEAGFGAENAA